MARSEAQAAAEAAAEAEDLGLLSELLFSLRRRLSVARSASYTSLGVVLEIDGVETGVEERMVRVDAAMSIGGNRLC